MTAKERKIEERALELWQIHEDWCEWKAQSVAVREYLQREKQRKNGKGSIRQIGLLEYWD